jgi:hypothetical protein
MIEPIQLVTLISVVSGIIGTALYVRARVEDHETRLAKHEAMDTEFHSSIVDRLARIETKIDVLSERGHR